jgi:glucans biosynthesis protein C
MANAATSPVMSDHAAQSSAAQALAAKERIHYLDNLRAIAMLLGVLLHAGMAYGDPIQQVWLATDIESSRTIDCTISFIHLFRMALFFLIAGYLGRSMIERKGAREFIKNRLLRLVVPFMIFWPLLLMAMGLTIWIGLGYIREPKGLLGLVVHGSADPAINAMLQERDKYPTMHLWFLYYLILFSASAVALRAIGGKLTWLSKFGEAWLAPLAPILLVPATIVAGAPMGTPESFIPTWWPFAFYGLYYLAGWQLNGRESILDHLQRWASAIAVVACVAFVAYYKLLPVISLTDFQTLNGFRLVAVSVLSAYLSALLVCLSLIVGRRFLDSRNALMRWVSDASYWTYLIHLPIVMFLQFLLVEVSLNVWIKLTLVVLGTVIACGTTYVVFVRYTLVGWLLNGKRTFP